MRAGLLAAVLALVAMACVAARPPRTAPAAKPFGLSSTPACPAIPGEEALASRVLLVGELHGTVEMPALFARLVCAAASREPRGEILVGLEIYGSAQDALERYLGSDGGLAARQALLEHAFWQREFQDGRSSIARVDLLEALRHDKAEGLRVTVVALDPGDLQNSPGERDAGMAAALVAAIESRHPARTLVLVGDIHARLAPGYPWDPSASYRSLGVRLQARYGDVDALRALASGGSAWLCTSSKSEECGVHPQRERDPAGPTPRIEADAEGAAKTGFTGTLFCGPVSPSLPARPDRRPQPPTPVR
jgi:hypothetical protein